MIIDMSNKQNEGWKWNWEWKWDWNGAKDSMKEDFARAHHHTHRRSRRRAKNFWPWFFVALLCGRDLFRAAVSLFRSLTHGLASGLSSIMSGIGSALRATSGQAVLCGLVIGVVIGLKLYKMLSNRNQPAEDEAGEVTEEKEPEQIDPVPIPMTLGNTPSSSDEEYVPQAYNTFGN